MINKVNIIDDLQWFNLKKQDKGNFAFGCLLACLKTEQKQ